jgi:glutamine amidotransferase/cyclase
MTIQVHLLDYGCGNIRSALNALKIKFDVKIIENPEDIMKAEILVFPGVGNFGKGKIH